jgi:signal peptidase I
MESPQGTRRRPAVAGLLAFVGAGLGHFYCGNIRAAVIWVAAWLAYLSLLHIPLVLWDAAPLNMIVALGSLIAFPVLHILHAIRTARRRPADAPLSPYNRFRYYFAWWAAVSAFSVPALSHLDSYKAYSITSSSMETTLFPGDWMLADHSAYDTADPVRGDVIVFRYPLDTTTIYVDRCVALPGDVVELRDARLHINGREVPDPPTVKFMDTNLNGEHNNFPRGTDGQDSRDNFGPYTVPPDRYFAMGDNRDNSSDSRFWGYVPRYLILGKAMRIHYSSDWSRIGQSVE